MSPLMIFLWQSQIVNNCSVYFLRPIEDCLIPLCWAGRHTIQSRILQNGRGWVNLNYAGGDSCYHHGQIPDIFAHRCIWKWSPPPLFHQVNFWNQDQMLPEFFLEPSSIWTFHLLNGYFELLILFLSSSSRIPKLSAMENLKVHWGFRQ